MTDVHISFVLDTSSSMAGLTGPTIESFNQYLADQQSQDGNAWMSLTLFDKIIDPRYVAWNVKDIPMLDRTTYVANGWSTSLYDAVGVAVKGAEKWQKNNEWFQGGMIVVIQTDGQENSSHEWTQQAVKELIDYKKAEGWTFIFLGTGEGSWTEAQTFSKIVGVDNTIRYKGADNAHAYSSVSNHTINLRSAATMDSYVAVASAGPDQSWNASKLENEDEDNGVDVDSL